LFRLAFRLLAGKVFYDRGIADFLALGPDSGPDAVLAKVAWLYNEPLKHFLNRAAREAMYDNIWSNIDFRNLSIDVLTHSWSTTLVTKELRREFGIHHTPRAVANYIVKRLPFEAFCDLESKEERYVIEPCCGTATFLIAAMQRLKVMLRPDTPADMRHAFFQRILVGFEQESFGIEVSRLCLTLADFPNRDGWQLNEANVLNSNLLPDMLRKAHVVLCNPPFEDWSESERNRYRTDFVQKPKEILHRVLQNLHPQGVLGFVMPRVLVDGVSYKQTRRLLVERFEEIELVTLPDTVFATADKETALLIASRPRPNGRASSVRHGKVKEADWPLFIVRHAVSSEDVAEIRQDDAVESLAIPELRRIWNALDALRPLREIAEIHRGIEWNLPLIDEQRRETGNRDILVLDHREEGYQEGIPPGASPFFAFLSPPTKYLSMKPEHQRRNSYMHPWHLPKVILNAKTKSRGPWRMAAFADFKGLACYQTFTGIWPKDPGNVVLFAAIVNGPVANAYVACREGKVDITNETLEAIPIPAFSPSSRKKIEELVHRYVELATSSDLRSPESGEMDKLLRHIDATILEAYDLPPRYERELLDFFRGEDRPVFPESWSGSYFPADFRPCFSLSDYLDKDFALSTVGEVKKRYQSPSEHVLRSLKKAARIDD
jgi:hypothetical protein